MNMKKHKLNRICSFVMAAVFATSMVGETLAFDWSQIADTTNEFQTGTYLTTLVEEFVSPDNWLPGQYTNKDVSVLNEGSVPVFAKIELEQEWIRRKNIYDYEGNAIAPLEGENFPLTFAADNGEAYAAIIHWGEDVVMLASDTTDISTILEVDEVDLPNLGIPTVDSIADAEGKWLLSCENTDGNLVFYYIGVLETNEETPFLIDGVEMNPEIQASILESHTTWSKEDDVWSSTTTYVENGTYDYENSTYTLYVTMYTVQATSSAVGEVFDNEITEEQTIVSYLETVAFAGVDVATSRDDSVTEKKLYLNETNGILTYTPDSPDENWFMSFFNMMPGETYTDTLIIENQTDDAYDLYMQAINKDTQEAIVDELLGYILLKVYYNEGLIYEGSAAGVDVDQTLFDVISLGEYLGGETNTIDIEVTLDKDLSLEYADVYTTTDWQFMVLEIDDDDNSTHRHRKSDDDDEPDLDTDPTSDPTPDPTSDPTPDPTSDPTPDPTSVPTPTEPIPQTGDSSDFMSYILVMLLSLIGFIVSIKKFRDSFNHAK